MNSDSIYYDTGEKYFTNGNSIYINSFCESSKPHLHAHDFIEISYMALVLAHMFWVIVNMNCSKKIMPE